MTGTRSPALPGAAAALLMAARIPPAATAFGAPVIFPLLWMGKRLTHDLRSGPRRLPTLPRLQGAADRKEGQRQEEEARGLVAWLDGFEGGSSAVQIAADARGLRGLYATRDIRKGEVFVEIPFEAALLVGDSLSPPLYDDYDAYAGAEALDADLVDDVFQGVDFLRYFADDPAHAPYTRMLPPRPAPGDEDGLTPDFWSDAAIADLQVPSFAERALERKALVADVARKQGLDARALRWATWMLRSRRITTYNMVAAPDGGDDDASLFGAFPLRRRQVEQVQGFLLPLIDMANHAQDPNAGLKITVNRWTREFDETSKFGLRALRAIKKGEEATILYGEGDRTSWDLLDKYGFFLEGNEADGNLDWGALAPEFDCSLADDARELARLEGASRESAPRVLAKTKDKLKTIVAKIQADYVPDFASKIEDLHLVGTGMRQKMGLNIYAVAMYLPASPEASRFSSCEELRSAAQAFGTSSPRTTFVLEIIFQPDTANTVAAAISRSVKLRHRGAPEDVQGLEDLITASQATKGSVLRFDCTADAVRVSANGLEQGSARCEGLGRAFADVFVDDRTVSPSLVEDCLARGRVAGAPAERTAVGRRSMLSFRVLMKRLSNWATADAVVDAGTVAPQEVSVAPVIAASGADGSIAETVVRVGITEQQAGEVASKSHAGTDSSETASGVTTVLEGEAHEGTASSGTAAGVADESVGRVTNMKQQEELVVSEPYEGTDLLEPASLEVEVHEGTASSDTSADVADESVGRVANIEQQEELAVSEPYEGTDLLETASLEVELHEGSASSGTAAGVANESVGRVANIEQQEELAVSEPYEGTDLSETASGTTDELGAEVQEGTDLSERAPVAVDDSDTEITKEADAAEAASDVFREAATEMLVSSPNIEDTAPSKIAPDQLDSNDSPNVAPGKGSTRNDPGTFDVNAVESRILELEAEIEAEIARAQATVIAVEPDQQPVSTTIIPLSKHVAATDRKELDVSSIDTINAVDKQAALEETARSKLEGEERQKEATRVAAQAQQKVDTVDTNIVDKQAALEETAKLESEERQREAARVAAEAQQKFDTVEDKMKSLKDKATGVTFAPKLEDGLYLVGVGVRKKAILNIYSVALYSHISVLEALAPFPQGKQKEEARLQLRNAARAFDAASSTTSLVLEMVFKADAQAMAGAIAEAVKPRYSGPASNVAELETLIVEGVQKKGGQATKGTVFRFDCTAEGVMVSVDGTEQGRASFEGMGSAFVDVFLDEKAVSPKLVDSCLSTWCESGLL